MADRRGWALSVRGRTTALAAVVVALALTVGSLILIATLDRSLRNSTDGLSRARAHDLAAAAERSALPADLALVGDNGVAQVVTTSGRVLAASRNITGAGPITDWRPAGTTPEVHVVRDAPDDNEREDYRVWAVTAQSPDGPVVVYVGSSLETIPEASRTLRIALAVGVPVTVALIAAAAWLLIGRALRPVEAIRAEVETISARALDRRVPVPRADDEISRLAVTMNRMLDRLDHGQRQQREFVADASHELQSPVAAMRTQLEVALAHPDAADWPRVAADLLEDCAQTERMAGDLLFLARLSDADDVRRPDALDLDDVVLEEAERIRGSATVGVDTSRVSAAPVVGNPDELRRLVRNLLDNGVRHATSSVRLTLSVEDGWARLDVADDGRGVAAADRPRVFDRFYRTDGSRSRDSGGTGLGLAIVRQIAEGHGGSIELLDEPGGAHFVVHLPVADPRIQRGFSAAGT